jgi:hypothetical protein
MLFVPPSDFNVFYFMIAYSGVLKKQKSIRLQFHDISYCLLLDSEKNAAQYVLNLM